MSVNVANYGTYQRYSYQTAPLPAWLTWSTCAKLLKLLVWLLACLLFGLAGIAAGLALFAGIYLVATLALAYIVQLIFGLALTALFAYLTYPRPRRVQPRPLRSSVVY